MGRQAAESRDVVHVSCELGHGEERDLRMGPGEPTHRGRLGRVARLVPDPDLERGEEELRQALGTKVSMSRTRRGGRIVIEYYGDEELERLYARLTGVTQ